MQFHRVPYLVVMLFLIYNRHFIGNTDLLILNTTEYLVPQQKQLPGLW